MLERPRASSIIPNSIVPVCVSTGIRPVSNRITKNSAADAKQMRRPHDLIRAAAHRRTQHVGQVGGGHQRDGEHDEQHHRLGDRRERLRPAGPELRI